MCPLQGQSGKMTKPVPNPQKRETFALSLSKYPLVHVATLAYNTFCNMYTYHQSVTL